MISPGLQLALDACDGCQARLARAAGVAQTTVWHWINTGCGRVPAERAPAVSRALGIPLAKLRPDLFDDAARDAAKADVSPVHAPER